MMSRGASGSREQIELTSLDELVPEEHLVRKLEKALDWSFIYEMVEPLYCEDNGRPSLDPVLLIKLVVIKYMFGIRSMRQTVLEVSVNNAYRWFLGLGLHDKVPHFSSFGKNYVRRFKDTDLFEQIFQHILKECIEAGLVDPSVVFVDSTHVKARANSHKYEDAEIEEEVKWYADELMAEIQEDREAHGKKPLKAEEEDETAEDEDSGDDESPKSSESQKGKPNKNTSRKKQKRQKKTQHKKISRSDPESGWFQKGEHKHVFAYSVQTACDRHGVVLGYAAFPGNDNDGKTFPELFKKLNTQETEIIVGDSAYKTPAIAKLLADNEIQLLSAYSRPKTKDGFFPKYEYVYDEQYDCYICPANQILKYSTTNREGNKEYKSDPKVCESCPCREQCTKSKNHVKVVTRHVWAEYVEQAEENRYTYGIREWYSLRKETIERVFASAKELHGFRYTQEYGKAQMEVKAALTFACLNLKKLAKKRWNTPHFFAFLRDFFNFYCTNPAVA